MLEWIITSCVLIGIVLLVRLCLKNRISLRLRYALWLIVLVRLLVPVNFFNSSMSVMNVVPESVAVTELQQPEILDAPEQTPSEPIGDTPVTQVPILPVNPTPITPVTPEVEEPVQLPQAQIPAQEAPPEKTFPVALLLQIIWVAGIAITGSVFLFANIRFALRLKRTREAQNAACPLRVYRTAVIDTPCLFGVFRPAIYLTEQAGEDEGRHHILTHEMTHYKHLDHIWGLLRCLCLALHWYNPLVWVAAICSRRDSELACDEAVIKQLGEDSRTEYGKTLIRMTCTKQNAAGIFTTATTMTGSKKTIKNRIKLIVKHPKTALYAVICLVLIAAIAVGCTFTGAKPPEKSDASTETTPEETETIEVSDPTETTSDVGASVPDDNLNWDYPYGRLVYIDGDLYAIQHVWYFGDSAEKIGSITNCDFDAIPSTDFSSNYFPVGTEVYKDGSYYFIRHPIDDSDAEPRLIPLCKTTLDREGGAPMLTLNDVREIVKKGDMNLFLDFRGYSFLSGPLSWACEIRDYDGFIIIDWDRVRLYRLCDLASIDPFADDLEAFLAEKELSEEEVLELLRQQMDVPHSYVIEETYIDLLNFKYIQETIQNMAQDGSWYYKVDRNYRYMRYNQEEHESMEYYYIYEGDDLTCYTKDQDSKMNKGVVKAAVLEQMEKDSQRIDSGTAIYPQYLTDFRFKGIDEETGLYRYTYNLPVHSVLADETMYCAFIMLAMEMYGTKYFDIWELNVRCTALVDPETMCTMSVFLDYEELKPYVMDDGSISAEYALMTNFFCTKYTFDYELKETTVIPDDFE